MYFAFHDDKQKQQFRFCLIFQILNFTFLFHYFGHRIDKGLRIGSLALVEYFHQRSYQRWLNKIIYKTEMKFWAVCGSRDCREKNSQLPLVQLSNQNPYFYPFQRHHPLITKHIEGYCSFRQNWWIERTIAIA